LDDKEIAMLSSHDLEDLRHRAAPVTEPCPKRQRLDARGAASALSGVVRLVSIQHGHAAMQRACAKLAQWSELPELGRSWCTAKIASDQAVAVLAAVADGVAVVAGYSNTRAALAFWACETDPAVWRDIAAAA